MPTLLLIDDDPVFLTMLARSLKRRGWDSLSAHDEAEALSLLAAPPAGIDGVLLDLNLAGYSGLRLIGPVREALPTVPVVVLTGYASIATAVDAIKLGATQYLPNRPIPLPFWRHWPPGRRTPGRHRRRSRPCR